MAAIGFKSSPIHDVSPNLATKARGWASPIPAVQLSQDIRGVRFNSVDSRTQIRQVLAWNAE